MPSLLGRVTRWVWWESTVRPCHPPHGSSWQPQLRSYLKETVRDDSLSLLIIVAHLRVVEIEIRMRDISGRSSRGTVPLPFPMSTTVLCSWLFRFRPWPTRLASLSRHNPPYVICPCSQSLGSIQKNIALMDRCGATVPLRFKRQPRLPFKLERLVCGEYWCLPPRRYKSPTNGSTRHDGQLAVGYLRSVRMVPVPSSRLQLWFRLMPVSEEPQKPIHLAWAIAKFIHLGHHRYSCSP